MASTYVSLVNQLLRRLNEVALDTSGDGFAGVKGVQALAKDAVNNSIRHILQGGWEFPFLKSTYNQTLVPLTQEYNFQSDMASVDWDTFFLKKHPTLGNEPRSLSVISYEEYTQDYRAGDETDDEGASPLRIYQTYGTSFGVTPKPDSDYTIEYVYWIFPNDLTLYNDTCIIPSRFDHIIVDGAMMYMMRFRSNDNQAAVHQASFEQGIKTMRRLLIDDPLSVRSTVIERAGVASGYVGVSNA